MVEPIELQIESVPAIPDADVVAALWAEGLAVVVIGSGDCLEVAVREPAAVTELSRRVGDALDRLIRAQPRSLVAARLGPLAFCIHPVAA
jgi:hypothetical protein